MIKGLDKHKRRLAHMKKIDPAMKGAMNDSVKWINNRAKLNVTAGHPLHVGTGALRANIHFNVSQAKGKTVGTVGIPRNVWYGKVHETGQPAIIRPKHGKYLKFRVGRRGKGPWVSVKEVHVKKRPWLHPAYLKNRPRIQKRFIQLAHDLVGMK